MTKEIQNSDLTEDEKKVLEELIGSDPDKLSFFGIQRRHFLKQVLGTGGALLAFQLLGNESLFADPPDMQGLRTFYLDTIENGVKISFKVNSISKSLEVDSRMTLLDTLRERLQLTGSKKGCDHGQCGACTVLVDGRRVLSCLTLAASCEGKSVQTIEGFAKEGRLHPLQEAFLKHDGFQCGFCTPGQICSAASLLSEAKNGDASYVTHDLRSIERSIKLTDDEIRERMSGNICRCGAYPNIVAAIREVQSGKEVAQNWQLVPEQIDADSTIINNIEKDKQHAAI